DTPMHRFVAMLRQCSNANDASCADQRYGFAARVVSKARTDTFSFRSQRDRGLKTADSAAIGAEEVRNGERLNAKARSERRHCGIPIGFLEYAGQKAVYSM